MGFAEEEDLSSDAVQMVLSLFGGGICSQGKTCGIVTGALAVLALRSSHVNPAAKEARLRARNSGADFMRWFEQQYGSSDCQTLTCVDFDQPGASRRFQNEQVKERVCLPLIEAAARRLVEQRSDHMDLQT
jgi:C_GCAxxG_C_C family probable redox protein